ncbi:unnamed protein product [Prorocentrum cordatum]|uniref:Feruloyl esterase n=1 Tax=Prorocentrum cordatum TaxID=2364126 RepID=A0ABN9RVC7_9DINO|nr:unnamed protein product [Polarella glacialis]
MCEECVLTLSSYRLLWFAASFCLFLECSCSHRRRIQMGSMVPVPSVGCGSNVSLNKDTLSIKTMPSPDLDLPEINRTYSVYLPPSYSQSSPSPLVMVFHGWGERGYTYHTSYGFGDLARENDFIAVYPQGVGDCQAGAECKNFFSWNGGGTTNNDQACGNFSKAYNKNVCYESCAVKTHGCNPCDWTTCYDDVAFVGKMLDSLQAEYCVDLRRQYAIGCSNGGVLSFELVKNLPGQFAGIGSACGARPHAGWDGALGDGPPVSLIMIGGDRDRSFPPYDPPGAGPPTDKSWWDGYIYAGLRESTAYYVEHNGCNGTIAREFPVGPYTANDMSCVEDGYDCQGGAGVVRCIFSGGHDFNRGTGSDDMFDGPQMMWDFLSARPLIGYNSVSTAMPAPTPTPSPNATGISVTSPIESSTIVANTTASSASTMQLAAATLLYVVTSSMSFESSGTRDEVTNVIRSRVSFFYGGNGDHRVVHVASASAQSHFNSWDIGFEVVAPLNSAEKVFDMTEEIVNDSFLFTSYLNTSFKSQGMEMVESSLNVAPPEMKISPGTVTSASVTVTIRRSTARPLGNAISELDKSDGALWGRHPGLFLAIAPMILY